jgi:hypothetical protein
VIEKGMPQGAMFIWSWGDQEIEDLKLLKSQLDRIYTNHFSGVVVTLGRTRYELIGPKVIRAISQSSQWAHNRNMSFWIQADPRRSSRTLINETNERTQTLLLMKNSGLYFNPKNLNIGRVKNNRFELRYHYSRFESFPPIQEHALYFNPIRLERSFLFQMQKDIIISDTVVDITASSRFYANISKGYVDVFGEILIPKDETWWVLAFPLFDTNLYDYAGHESNDRISKIVEDLFDTGTYLNGIVWDKISYNGDIGRISISSSIYNSFKAEYGYDLRDVLYRLVLDMDDRSHIRTRNDYHTLLHDLAFHAQKKFYQMAHSFFGDLYVGTEYTLDWHNHHIKPCCYTNPWKGLNETNIGLSQLQKTKQKQNHMQLMLSMLTVTKSLGVFSENQSTFASLSEKFASPDEEMYWLELMSLFSIQFIFDNQTDQKTNIDASNGSKTFLNKSNQKHIARLNNRYQQLREITQFIFPEADTLLIFPTETITSLNCEDAEDSYYTIHQLIGNLVMQGIQLDVVSASLLKECRLSSNRIHIRGRSYDAIIYPYPNILDPKSLEILSLLDKVGFPVFLGGSNPKWTTAGKRIPHVFPIKFDPKSKNLSALFEGGIRPLFQMPENAIGTMIQNTNEILFLLHPQKPGGSFKGEIQYGKIRFKVPKSSKLTIYRKRKNKPADKIL